MWTPHSDQCSVEEPSKYVRRLLIDPRTDIDSNVRARRRSIGTSVSEEDLREMGLQSVAGRCPPSEHTPLCSAHGTLSKTAHALAHQQGPRNSEQEVTESGDSGATEPLDSHPQPHTEPTSCPHGRHQPPKPSQKTQLPTLHSPESPGWIVGGHRHPTQKSAQRQRWK